jgi:two-component system LytT family response regulator/two-component system response regulator LytT
VSARVLVVDDEPMVVEALREILAAAGYEPLGATSFEEGRRLLLAPPAPDVVVADVRLGKYNGLQLVVLRPQATAAIVISGHWDEVIEAEARQLGAVYLQKPLASPVLAETVARLIAEKSPGGKS